MFRLKRLEETEETMATECTKLKEELAAVKEELDNCNKNFKRLKKQNALITWVNKHNKYLFIYLFSVTKIVLKCNCVNQTVINVSDDNEASV